MLNPALALLPVLAFLGALVVFDSFKLTSWRAVGSALAVGSAAAVVAAGLNSLVAVIAGPGPEALSRYAAPVVEEALKAAYVISLVHRGRVGFLVDTLILAFAVGAGFALTENLVYLTGTAQAPPALWLVRGVGTATLHGACTTLVGLTTRTMAERGHLAAGASLGLGCAIALHAAYNQFILPPVTAAVVLVSLLPLVVGVIYWRSEQTTRRWMMEGFDADVEVLRAMTSPAFGETRIGRYLRSLADQLPGQTVADMFCLVRIELELAVRARGLLMAREAGLAAPVGEDIAARLAELRYLRQQIGATGLVALRPLRPQHRRSDWGRVLLEAATK